MALGATQFNAPAIVPDFSAGLPMVKPVQVLPSQEAKSPIDTLKEVFFDIRDGIKNLVQQSKEALGLQKEEDREQDIVQSLSPDDKVATGDGESKSIIDSLKEQFESLKEGFGNVTIGEKLKAALLVGALALFLKVSDSLVPVVKKIVEGFQFVRDNVFGDTENPGANTLLSLLGIIAAFKILPLVTAAFSVSKFLGGKMLTGIKLLGKAFTAMRTFIVADMIPAIFKTYGGVKGKLFTAITRLGLAFTALRTFILASMIPAITGMIASLAPVAVALAPFILIGAAIAAVLYSMKSGFDAFRQSLEDGDSMLTAIGKGLLDFTATLVTLPLTLLKGIVSYFAGIFGFDNFKEKLDNFSFKDGFINIITGFVNKVKSFFTDVLSIDVGAIISKIGDIGSKVANTLKAIAKGSVAMIAAAAPGGESPTEAFSRVYNEVLSTGTDTPVDVAKSEVADTALTDASTTMAAAKSAITQDAAYTVDNRVFNTTNSMMREKIITIIEKQLELELEKNKSNQAEGKSMMVVNKAGDSVVQNSSSFVAGSANSDHTDNTAKILSSTI
tara:strand:+ start:21 stop:1694 length:1674 start_codon:yes stop_codon:yes gene_type:complete